MRVQMTYFSNPSVIHAKLEKHSSRPEKYRVSLFKGDELLFWHNETLPFKKAWIVGESLIHAYKLGSKQL